MALSGRLEDMNLLEILQIVAFSKKTGTLNVSGSIGMGAVLFRDGRLLCAFSSSTSSLLRSLAKERLDATRIALLKEQIRTTLGELVRLREGRFEFRISDSLPLVWEGLDVSNFLLTEGVDPQELMLALAKELDESRRQTSRMLAQTEASPQEPHEKGTESEPAEPLPTVSPSGPEKRVDVLVVDDEPVILDALTKALESPSRRVLTASGTAEALPQLQQLLAGGGLFVLVTDLAMPSSDGQSFQGGFELAERVFQEAARPPVLLMAESLTPGARARARELGIRKVAFKPTLTKLDAEDYASDLRAFGSVVKEETRALLAASEAKAAGPAALPVLNHDVIFEFLKTMTAQLTHPASGIARMVLRVASKYVERAQLFLVRDSRATGLAGIQAGVPMRQVAASVKQLSFDLQEVEPFAEVVYTRVPFFFSYDRRPLPPALDRGRAEEAALLPMLHSHEVIAILLCDNPNSGAPVAKLTGLELFLAQAGMAMENASLHRRLHSLESQFSIEDQGPLTQELTQIVRGRE